LNFIPLTEYGLQNLAGWAFMLIGVGLLSTMGANTSIGVSIPFQIITAFGLGFEYATTFAVLAPLDASLNAQALAFLMFSRTFAQVRIVMYERKSRGWWLTNSK
jgi:hypothetical protein